MCCSDFARQCAISAIDAQDRHFDMSLTTQKRQEQLFGKYKGFARRKNLMNPMMADGIIGAMHHNRQVVSQGDERTITSLKHYVRPLVHLRPARLHENNKL